MALLFALAWRNLWRNRKRTWITASSVYLAVAMALVTRSLQEGSYGHMIHTTVGATTGYIQLHGRGYWDDQTLDRTFAAAEAPTGWDAVPGIRGAVPRLQSFALAFEGRRLLGVPLTGIDPGVK